MNDDIFRRKPHLLDVGPNVSDAASVGMPLGEYERAWEATRTRHIAERDTAANERAVDAVKASIRTSRVMADRGRVELARLSAKGNPVATRAVERQIVDLDFKAKDNVDRLAYMVRGLPAAAQRRHLADVGEKG